MAGNEKGMDEGQKGGGVNVQGGGREKGQPDRNLDAPLL